VAPSRSGGGRNAFQLTRWIAPVQELGTFPATGCDVGGSDEEILAQVELAMLEERNEGAPVKVVAGRVLVHVGRFEAVELEAGVGQEQVELVLVVLPVVAPVWAVSRVWIVDIDAGDHLHDIFEAIGIRCRQDEYAVLSKNALDLLEGGERIGGEVLDDLAAEHDVETVILEGKALPLNIEDIRAEPSLHFLARREVAINDRLLHSGNSTTSPPFPPGCVTGTEVVRELQLKLRELAKEHRREVRIGPELEAAAYEALNEIAGPDEAPKVFTAVGQELLWRSLRDADRLEECSQS
jgi:hypothetical protein